MASSEARIAYPDVGIDENALLVSEAISSSGVQGTSLDLLKNTPSNIAKLEDVIEHSKGREKYLAQTRSPSDGGDVRWYFCKVPLAENELAASIPRTEIVGKGDYFRFGMRDSLAIEASFLQREEGLLSSWWKEYAECSEGPKERPSSIKNSDKQQTQFSVQGGKLSESEEERVGVPVKGGLYEVDLVKRHCFPVYWNGENRRVLRGHWFARQGGLDWLPLREDVAEQLEIAYRRQVWHRRTFQPSGLFASRVDLQGSTPGLHALFTGEDDTWEAWLNSESSGFSSVIGLIGNGIKLRRGYSISQSPKLTQDELRQRKEEEMDDYCSQVPVRHLVFMVHGIGQRLEKSNLVDDVGNFRHITSNLAERHLTSHQRGTQRVLFIPCQWRKGLKLNGEAAVEKITLNGVRGLRVMLGATSHDILYYMSAIYCQDIINSVSNQLNRLYLKFLRRNPGYDGKVSIYGHSLGSVLSYDILCHQENLSSPFPMDRMYRQHSRSEEFFTDAYQSPKCDGYMEDKNCSAENETAHTVHLADKKTGGGHQMLPAHEEGHSESSSTVVNSVTSDLDEHLDGSINYEQTIGKEDDYDSTDVHSHKKDELEEPMNLACGLVGDTLEKLAEQECVDSINKEEVIKSLREEVESLKKKIAEFELQRAGSAGRDTNLESSQGNKEVRTNLPMEPVPEIPPPGKDNEPESYTPYIKYKKLEFKVDTFFAVGSPLGVFLALRNIRIGIGKGQEYWGEEDISEEMPACQQMFNIFHPFDPVAYRIEPLVCKEYICKCPVIVPYHKGGRRLHIGFQEFTEDLAARSQAIMDHLHTVRVKVLTVCQSRKADNQEEEAEHFHEEEENSYGSQMILRLTGSDVGRIDHMLQDKTFQHPYLQAIGAHTNYWRDYDTALFILKHLYRDIPEESDRCISKEGSSSVDWPDHRDTADEELPLTFSDNATVRNFSRNSKKIMKH